MPSEPYDEAPPASPRYSPEEIHWSRATQRSNLRLTLRDVRKLRLMGDDEYEIAVSVVLFLSSASDEADEASDAR